MTTDAAAPPDAPAVYLEIQEATDDRLHMHSVYARIKVLTDKGKSFGDVEIRGYNGRSFAVTDVAARTIHADGTVIPLSGKPLEKILLRQGKDRFLSTVFGLPAVEPGSILEYRYKMRYDDNIVVPPRWNIQQALFVHKAHYHFQPQDGNYIITNAYGDTSSGYAYAGILPNGQVKFERGAYDLDVVNVPPLPDESCMPPISSLSCRLLFYYQFTKNSDEYWKKAGKRWSKEVDHFANPSSGMHAAVDSLTSPADAPEVKLHKLYDAVMKLENTSFTREHTAAENKAEGLRIKTADDIWAQKRGNSTELDRLFLALARAAGFKAYDMIVVNRDTNLMMTDYMDWDQLDDEIAVINLNGKDTWYDAGQRYAEFGKLHWKHTMARGVRQTEGGNTIIDGSAGVSYKDNQVSRVATLGLGEHGELTGNVRISMSGAPALHWRQRALEVDEEALRRDYEQSVRGDFPPGVEVKMDHFIGLTDPDHMLMAVLKVNGSVGSSTGRRILLPASFFASSATSLFPQQKRQNYVDLHYAVSRQDQVTIKLPAGVKVESLPQKGDFGLPQCAGYVTVYGEKDGVYSFVRKFVLAVALYKPEEYPALRDFYMKMGAKDQEQAVLTASGTTAVGAGTNAAGSAP
ncbi:MAG TPA: DUF3857 domain-containing protein [Acidobacteriaceae bacterium]